VCMGLFNFRKHDPLSRVADPDPGSGVFCPLDPESGIGNKSGSGMNNLGHISESLETIF
jgi:hypothetical protein